MGQSSGQGSFSVSQRQLQPNGPPFAIASAVNGLSVDALGRIVLGQDFGAVGDPAILLNNREIPMGGFAFQMRDGAFRKFLVDNANSTYFLGDRDGQTHGAFFNIDNLGDFSLNSQTQGYLNILSPLAGSQISMNMNGGSPGGMGWLMDGANGQINQGDLFGGLNFTQIQLDDTNQAILMGDDPLNTNPWLTLDKQFDNYVLGDFFQFNNGTMLRIRDLGNTLVQMTGLIGANKQRNFFVFNGGATPNFQWGDVGNNNLGIKIFMDDATGQIRMNNLANTAKIVMNGVNGFTGVVAPVNTITVNGGIVTNVA